MITFHRTFLDKVIINETRKVIKNCKLYNILTSGNQIGRFYSGDNYSFAEFEEQKIRIDSEKHFFTNSEYKIYNQYTGDIIGNFEIPNGGIGRTGMTSMLYLSNGDKYRWTENKDHRNIIRPSTLSIYKFDFVSITHSIIYYGKMTPDIALSYVNPNQIFEGEIQTSDDRRLMPIIMGIYIMEEKFRRQEQDLG